MYRPLDTFLQYSDELQVLIAEKTKQIFGRDSILGYWDVTNYYFEIPYEDEDEIDGDKIKKGFRKGGPSKEHRNDPIVQMGLLMDSKGIPIAFNIFSGGESEKTNMLPTIKKVKKDHNIQRIIIIADKGLNTSANTAYLSGKNNEDSNDNDGYVYGQSIILSDKDFKEWILKKDDYKKDIEITKDGETVTFIHKSRIATKNVTLKDSSGKK